MSRASSSTSQARQSNAVPPNRSHRSTASSNFPSQPHNSRQVRWGSDQVIERSQLSPGMPSIEPGSEGQEEEEEEGMNGICLAISVVRGKLGCAYYDSNDNKIYFLGDQPDSSEFDLAKLVLGQLLPTNVLSPVTADSTFLDFLESTLSTLPTASSASGSTSAASFNTSSDRPTRFEIRPAREFYAGQGRQALSQLEIREGAWYRLDEGDVQAFNDDSNDRNRDSSARSSRRNEGVEGDALKRNRELRLESFMNGLENSPLTLGCAGALLASITRIKAAGGDLEATRFEVSGLELMKLDKVMQINAESLTSLAIFDQEAHASMHSTRGKEGLSIFGIVNMTRTPLGSVLMRQWLIRPSLELELIEQRHETVACLLRTENASAVEAIRKELKMVKNANKALATLLHGRGSLREWLILWQMLYASILVFDATLVLTHSRKVDIVERLKCAIDVEAFRTIGKTINEVIDWETTVSQKGRVCVRQGIDTDLDELRRQLNGLPSLLSRIASEVAVQLPQELIPELSFIYFPQLGYLIRTTPKTDAEYIEECARHGFEFQFYSDASAFFKSDQCRDLDEHLGDLQSLVVVQALLDEVAILEGPVKATTEVLSELDCLLAFAEAARIYDWNRPKMTDSPVCRIQGGRHPLSELCVSFVKNDTDLIGGRGIDWRIKDEDEEGGQGQAKKSEISSERSVIVVAGANFSGKSIYLKQIALITYMAHLGCFVPADKALIGLTDRIMTRVTTRESITKGSSAFMIDLQQISYMLRNATPRSLLIIDEFGKGTDSNDGAGLFCGVIEFLLGLGRDTPRVAVATHFQAVFANGLLSRSLPVHLAHMEVLIHESPSSFVKSTSTSDREGSNSSSKRTANSQGVETLTYLYRLSPGLMTSSHAAACARLFDLPEKVVQRASFVTKALNEFDIEAILRDPVGEDAEVVQAREREWQDNETIAQRFVDWDLDSLAAGKDGYDVEEIRGKLFELLDV
ncbi:hypothetical protein JCM5353_004733 [Sporobolomyces roseus]